MRDDGQPTTPGWYWTLRQESPLTERGELEAVRVVQWADGEWRCDGFGEMNLSEIGYAWQKVKPPEELTWVISDAVMTLDKNTYGEVSPN